MHMLAEYGKGKSLFRGAILESGTATSTIFPSASDVQPEYDAIVTFTNCTAAASSLDCIRALPVEVFVAVTNNSLFQWAPVIDGTFLTDRPSRLMKADKMVHVPLLIGGRLYFVLVRLQALIVMQPTWTRAQISDQRVSTPTLS